MSTQFVSTEAAREGSQWWIVDASNIPVGRLASEVATIIRGKHRPTYTPNVDGGDFVIVVNAEKAVLTGNKGETKRYQHHTGYIGSVKDVSGADMLRKNPERAIELAVGGMLPEGILGHRLKGKLKVYRGSEHPHHAQSPQPLTLNFKSKQK